MVIRKLNSLFHKHSRILFGAFTVLIIIAFTDFLSPGRIGGCSADGSSTAGTAFGKKVSYNELSNFSRNISVAQLLAGRRINTPDIESLFSYYCVFLRAEQLGLSAGADEIAKVIASNVLFQTEGKFDAAKYDAFLKENRLSDTDISNALRLQIIEGKLQNLIINSAKTSEDEIIAFYKSNNANFDVKVCRIDLNKMAAPKVSDAELKNFYNANKSKYIQLGYFEALIAEIPFAPFKNAAEKAVSAAEVDKVAAEYGKQLVGADGKAMPKEEIRKQLVSVKQNEFANRHAGVVTRVLYQELKNAKTAADQLKIFRDWAAKNRLVVTESGKCTFNSRTLAKKHLPKIAAELQNMSRQGLQITHQEAGDKGICIAILKNRTESRQQNFEEVKAAVTRDFIRNGKVKAAQNFAKQESVKLNAEKDLKKRSAAFDKLPGKFTSFKFPSDKIHQSPAETQQLYYIVAQQLRALSTGEISPAIDTADGAVLANVIKRTPANMSKFNEQKEMIKNQLGMLKSEMLYRSFMMELNNHCKLLVPGKQAE